MKNYAAVLLIAPAFFLLSPYTGFAAPVEGDSNAPEPITLGFWLGYSTSSFTFISNMNDTQLFLASFEVTHSHFNILNTQIGLSTQLILFGLTDFPKNWGIRAP